MKLPRWRGVTLCAVITLLAPSSTPVDGHLAGTARKGISNFLFPGQAVRLPVPARAVPLPPAPAPRAEAVERTMEILAEQAHPSLRGSAPDLAERIVDLSLQYDMEPELVLAVIQTESSFRPWVRSRAGAVGLMQLLPRTARPLARELDIPWQGADTLRDPSHNIRLGVHYLAQLRDQFGGDLELALAAYNLGPARVKRYVSKGKRPVWYAGKVERHRQRFLEIAREASPATAALASPPDESRGV